MRKSKLTKSGLTLIQSLSIEGVVVSGLAASGTTQATAAACTGDTNVFTTVPAGSGCQIGIDTVGSTITNICPGDEYIIVNHGANPLSVYPPVGGKINNGALNAAVTVAVNSSVFIKAITAIDLVAL